MRDRQPTNPSCKQLTHRQNPSQPSWHDHDCPRHIRQACKVPCHHCCCGVACRGRAGACCCWRLHSCCCAGCGRCAAAAGPAAAAALALLPEHFWPLHVVLGKVEAAGIAQGLAVVLVLAPEGRVASAAVLADLLGQQAQPQDQQDQQQAVVCVKRECCTGAAPLLWLHLTGLMAVCHTKIFSTCNCLAGQAIRPLSRSCCGCTTHSICV